MSPLNRKVVLASRPTGRPDDSNFALLQEPAAPLEDGQVLVAVDLLGIDAFIRTTLDEGSFHRGARLGGVIPALGVGEVIDSRSTTIRVGDKVFGPLGSQTHAVMPAVALRKLDTDIAPANAWLGALGLTTGLTAYFGIVDVGRVKKGDTVVVSGAAGAVGSVAGQIARLSGADKVIGIAGGSHKTGFLVEELGFDAAIDYRHENVGARLDELAPNGIDVFFDNVGGEILDDVLMRIVEGSRIVICGAISQYENMDEVRGPRNYLKLAERHATMEGFAVFHFAAHYARAENQLAEWYRNGDIVMREHIEHGVENFPAVMNMLMTGGHHGKLLLKVSSETV
jgi:NADPH-dependent curcumin reductase CurA